MRCHRVPLAAACTAALLAPAAHAAPPPAIRTGEDRVSDYVTSEVALDYAASTVLLLAAVTPR